LEASASVWRDVWTSHKGTTVSSVVMEDEREILKSLRDIKDLLYHLIQALRPNLVPEVF